FSRLRRLAGVQIPIRMRAASNPGGVGHEWVLNRFPILKPPTAGRVFISARVGDNTPLDKPEYIRSLGGPGDVGVARPLKRDWTVQNEGLVFPDLHTCVVDPKSINRTRVLAGVDWGYHNPAAVVVGVLDADDVLWIVEEVYGSKMTMDGHKPGNEKHNQT